MADIDSRRIAWFTPLRPVESGISLYSEELLRAVGSDWPIDVFVDGYVPQPFTAFRKLRVFNAREFERRDRRERYVEVVYQFGNSPAHAYMYEIALSRPGLVVMHDTVLHHLKLSMVTRRGGAAHYRDAMRREYGEEGARAAERVLQGRLPATLFDFPLSEDVIRGARHVAVHSEFSRAQVRGWVPEADVSVIPMGIRLPPLIDKRVARRLLNLADDVFIVASITMVNPYKRLDVVLQALSRLKRRTPVYFSIAGNVSPHVPLDRWVSLYGLQGEVERFGFVDDRTARLLAAAADALVNLRFPTAGETSASLLRIMAAGRPVLMSDAGSFRELPDDAVAKVPVDALEVETLEALLEALWSDPELSRQLGANARAFIEERHSLGAMVAAYHDVLHYRLGLELPVPTSIDSREMLVIPDGVDASHDPLMDAAGRSIAEMGLAGDDRLQHGVAEALADLGLLPDKM